MNFCVFKSRSSNSLFFSPSLFFMHFMIGFRSANCCKEAFFVACGLGNFSGFCRLAEQPRVVSERERQPGHFGLKRKFVSLWRDGTCHDKKTALLKPDYFTKKVKNLPHLHSHICMRHKTFQYPVCAFSSPTYKNYVYKWIKCT